MICECHGHIILDGVAYAGAVARHKNGLDELFIHNNLKINAESGVIFYRDGGDKHGVSLFAKKIAVTYGIDYRTPLYIIHKRGHYGSMFGRAFDSTAEYRDLVSEAKNLGADFIKVAASGLLDFANGGVVTGPSLAADELREMIDIAHGEGFAVMAHANGADSIKRAVESGADSIEHGFYIDATALRMMADTGAVWVPTCSTVSNLIGCRRYDDGVLHTIIDGHRASLAEASAMGVPVACGSDAGASHVPQGGGTLDEISILDSLGIDFDAGNKKIEKIFKRS